MEAPALTPRDEFNEALLANVHPADWVNPKPKPDYHLVVIGAGAGGLVSAVGAASLGARVAIVERAFMGGDCLNVGCVPSKAVIRASRVAHEIRSARHYGIGTDGGAQPDFGEVMRRMRRLRAKISPADSVQRLTGLGVDVFLGEGQFEDGRTVVVNGERLRFRKCIIAAGGRPLVPPIPGLPETGYLTNETVFNLTERPRSLLILGGGPIGAELAQAFRRLGSEVAVVAMDPHFLPREDDDAAQILHKQFQKEGIAFHFNATLAKVEQAGALKRATVNSTVVSSTVKKGEQSFTIEAEQILVAAGRVANVEGLNLEAANVALRNKLVGVDARLRTANPRIFAVGDVCLPYQFTHLSGATGGLAIQNALFRGKRKWTDLVVPWATFTDPEIAHVGLYERQAQARGIPVETFTRELREVDRAILDGDEEGFVKVHVRKGTDKIVGATIVARHAGEMISELTLAINAGIGLKKIASTIHPYPTQAEAIQQVGGAWYKTKLTPGTKRFLKLLLRVLN
jgi:pyruvate/2-oxoglutarate dehydrogenase complex dihydrolipoamide dehydrogenase (E3) component